MTLSNGALLDTRTPEQKLKDVKFKEVVASANPVNWTEKNPSTYRKFPIFNQDGSGSCVAQTEAKELGIMRQLKDGNYVHFSATDIYQRRSNKPNGGMGAADVRQIAKEGVTLEILVPSQNMGDAQMDNASVAPYMHEVGKVFAITDSINLTAGNIEEIASVIQTTGKGVMVWFYFAIDEWTERPVVKYPTLTIETGLRHSVTAVDFTLVNGKKCLIIEDSWGTSYGLAGQRIIDEDFLKARNWYASYLVNFKFDQPPVVKPHYSFALPMEFGQTSADIKALQDILKYETLLPTNISSTGYYGALTAQAVLKFQKKYQVAPDAELDPLQGRRCGQKTIAKLNQLYL